MQNFAEAFSQPVLKALEKLPDAILAFAVGVIVLHLLQWIIERVLRLARTPRTLYDILTSMSQFVLWVILLAVIFQSLGLTQVALGLTGSVAILGIAVATGTNTLVQDIIAGLFLSRDRDFDVGMTIKTSDIEGVIKRIDLRKVRIEDKKGRVHVLPNSNLDKTSWVVLSRGEK